MYVITKLFHIKIAEKTHSVEIEEVSECYLEVNWNKFWEHQKPPFWQFLKALNFAEISKFFEEWHAPRSKYHFLNVKSEW